MKKYIVTGAIIVIVLLVLYDIEIGDLDYRQTHDVLSSKIDNSPTLTQSDMQLYLIENNYNPSLYEPSEGCYLGAYVLANDVLNYDMAEFDRKTGKKHGIYKYNLTLGKDFPANWLLECVAKMKTPFIVLNPAADKNLDEVKLESLAKKFGEISIPVFLEVYGDAQRYTILPEEYKAFYIKLRKIFTQYAPNVSFVWSVDINNVYSSGIYYPGNTNVDWVGVSIYEPVYKGNDKYDMDLWSNFDFFYNTYNKNKPIMISEFAVSHYSNVDHAYYIQDAKNHIKEFYTTIKMKYPRVKLINYMDFNGIENYKVTDDETILKTYNEVINDKYFISEIAEENKKTDKQVFKSAFSICKNGDELYISNRFLEYELGLTLYSDDNLEYENLKWYPLDIIKVYKNCEIQIKDNNIYIEILE
jgi:hypothetical protein